MIRLHGTCNGHPSTLEPHVPATRVLALKVGLRYLPVYAGQKPEPESVMTEQFAQDRPVRGFVKAEPAFPGNDPITHAVAFWTGYEIILFHN